MTKGIVKEEMTESNIQESNLETEKSNTHTQNKTLAYMHSEAITVQISTMRAQTWKYMNAYISRLTEAEIKWKY